MCVDGMGGFLIFRPPPSGTCSWCSARLSAAFQTQDGCLVWGGGVGTMRRTRAVDDRGGGGGVPRDTQGPGQRCTGWQIDDAVVGMHWPLQSRFSDLEEVSCAPRPRAVCTPSQPRVTVPSSDKSATTSRTTSEGTAKPIPTDPPPGDRIAVFTPITSPSLLNSGPPELPRLIAASVWMNSS